MDVIKQLNDQLSFKDEGHKMGLHGHVKIEVEDPETKKKSLWYESDNIIPISGTSWILMKMFGLHLDSVHDPSVSYENVGQDTSTIIPDLNSVDRPGMAIGRDPDAQTAEGGYTPMEVDISADHFIQGFMVGNGGAAEDSISTKNTDYCYVNLRSPIPFQQTSGALDSSLAGKYLGVLRQAQGDKKYYIKKFDERAHIYHNWWRDGQKWDYIDPITHDDLGPDADSAAKTNRIETYAEVGMSIDTKNGDCLGYFQNNGNTQAAEINELGLVAFDVLPGARSMIERLYDKQIKRFLDLVFDIPELVDNALPEDYVAELIAVATEIKAVFDATGVESKGQTNINAFATVVKGFATSTAITETDVTTAQGELVKNTNIEVKPMYDLSQKYVYETDKFMTYMSDAAFEDLSVDEAQRIKLVTYYTFKSIPLQNNWKIIISYRIYAN